LGSTAVNNVLQSVYTKPQEIAKTEDFTKRNKITIINQCCTVFKPFISLITIIPTRIISIPAWYCFKIL